VSPGGIDHDGEAEGRSRVADDSRGEPSGAKRRMVSPGGIEPPTNRLRVLMRTSSPRITSALLGLIRYLASQNAPPRTTLFAQSSHNSIGGVWTTRVTLQSRRVETGCLWGAAEVSLVKRI